MSTVFNWQLGRDMDFPCEAAYPDRQFGFVFNLSRCIGCQSCTMACKSAWTFSRGQENMWWNNVGAEKGVKGQYFKDGEALPQHKTWFFCLARTCNHCSYPVPRTFNHLERLFD